MLPLSTLLSLINIGLQQLTVSSRRMNLLPIQRDFIFQLLNFAMSHNYFWFSGSYYLQNRGVTMDAKFAPSIVHLFMSKWKGDVIYANRRPELVVWRRYIDDVLLLWNGRMQSLEGFIENIIDNQLRIVLQHEARAHKIHFLDLNIEVKDGSITTTYFKETDLNSFIGQGSCHHPPWHKSVPRSQFIRLRRKYSLRDAYLKQAMVLRSRVVDRG